jgi:hypothetical protein
MGMGIVPKYNRKLPQADYEGDGSGIAIEIDSFDSIANWSKIPKLSSFVIWDRKKIRYFNASDGLACVHALIDAIESTPGNASVLSDAPFTLRELRELKRCLEIANANHVGFALIAVE